MPTPGFRMLFTKCPERMPSYLGELQKSHFATAINRLWYRWWPIWKLQNLPSQPAVLTQDACPSLCPAMCISLLSRLSQGPAPAGGYWLHPKTTILYLILSDGPWGASKKKDSASLKSANSCFNMHAFSVTFNSLCFMDVSQQYDPPCHLPDYLC